MPPWRWIQCVGRWIFQRGCWCCRRICYLSATLPKWMLIFVYSCWLSPGFYWMSVSILVWPCSFLLMSFEILRKEIPFYFLSHPHCILDRESFIEIDIWWFLAQLATYPSVAWHIAPASFDSSQWCSMDWTNVIYCLLMGSDDWFSLIWFTCVEFEDSRISWVSLGFFGSANYPWWYSFCFPCLSTNLLH